jgi:hypothetical protein
VGGVFGTVRAAEEDRVERNEDRGGSSRKSAENAKGEELCGMVTGVKSVETVETLNG